MSFRPFGDHDVRVVSDLLRFDFENAAPRVRSRNTTPNSVDIPLAKNPPRAIIELSPEQKHRAKPVLEPRSDDYVSTSDIYLYYTKAHTKQALATFAPYPPSVYEENQNIRIPSQPKTPSSPKVTVDPIAKDNYETYYSPRVRNKDLPPDPMTPIQNIHYNKSERYPHEKSPYIDQSHKSPHQSPYKTKKEADTLSVDLRQKVLEEKLLRMVMNGPHFSFTVEGRRYSITINFLLYVFEIISAIIVITLAGILANNDANIGRGFYQYFIADQVLSLLTAVLFLTNVVNYEKRNGSFYCVVAAVLTLVSFIMVVLVILLQQQCALAHICRMRKAMSLFIIISTFVWFCDLVMFLTTMYISRLDLLEEVNFDFSGKGAVTHGPAGPQLVDPSIDPATGKPIPQFFMRDNGEMIEYDGSYDVSAAHKMIVYVE